MTTTEQIEAVATQLNLSIVSEFVPFSRSRYSNNKQPCLNWKVTLKKGTQTILTTDYMAGLAHCPSYKSNSFQSLYMHDVKKECETGKHKAQPILPKLADVLACLVMDAEAIDYSSFEEWSTACGYDTDSIKALRIYEQCLQTALKLRAGIGEEGLCKLRKVLEQY